MLLSWEDYNAIDQRMHERIAMTMRKTYRAMQVTTPGTLELVGRIAALGQGVPSI